MEAGQLEIGGTTKSLMGAYPVAVNPSIPVAQAEHYGSPKVAPELASSAKKRVSTVDSHFPIGKSTPPSNISLLFCFHYSFFLIIQLHTYIRSAISFTFLVL